jgi:hypothetical protein
MIINGKWMSETEIIALISQLTADKKRLERQLEQTVKHGEWEEISEYNGWGDTYYRSSICGDEWDLDIGTPVENGMKYCPNCGADMRGDESNA